MTNEAKNWSGFEASSIGNHVILQYQLFIIMLGGLVMNGKLSGRGPIFDGPQNYATAGYIYNIG